MTDVFLKPGSVAWRILTALTEAPEGLQQRELLRKANVSAANTTRNFGPLEGAGYARALRTSTTHVIWTITEAGKKALADAAGGVLTTAAVRDGYLRIEGAGTQNVTYTHTSEDPLDLAQQLVELETRYKSERAELLSRLGVI